MGTETKLFSGAKRVSSDAKNRGDDVSPNVAVAPFDAAWPGALPSLNARAVDLAARLGIALGGTVAPKSSFDRKHYFYADQPHGYQITQHKNPIVTGGALDVFLPRARPGGKKRRDDSNDAPPKNGGLGDETLRAPERDFVRLRIERLQLETDTGKSAVVPSRVADFDVAANANENEWLVDYNRAGCALVEIVTLPDLRTPEEASRAVEAFRDAVRFLEVGDANMEDGSLRVDVNVSVRRRASRGDENVRPARFAAAAADDDDSAASPVPDGERCEIKNLNSLRSVARAVRAEAKRQIEVLETGGFVRRETRRFDPATNTTHALRAKECSADYRFSPEPDVPLVSFSSSRLAAIARSVPELPNAAKRRLVDPEGAHALRRDLAETVAGHPTTLDAYERALGSARRVVRDASKDEREPITVSPVFVANWVVGELVGAAKRAGVVRSQNAPLATLPPSASPERIGELLALVALNECTARMAKAATAAMLVARPNADGGYPTARETVAELFGGRDGGGNASGAEDASGEAARDVIDASCESSLLDVCVSVVRAKPDLASQFRSGNARLAGLFVGEAMRRSKGTADPRVVARMVREALEKEDP